MGKLLFAVFFLTVSLNAFAQPPGLQKKGMTTMPGGKTPPGWEQGLKKGWDKDKDWYWNKKTHLWENKNWKWNSKTNSWKKISLKR